jgi:hypothetical protein
MSTEEGEASERVTSRQPLFLFQSLLVLPCYLLSVHIHYGRFLRTT